MFTISNKLNKAGAFRFYCQKAAKGARNTNVNQSVISKTYGQPTLETHPYLIKRNEVTPLITKTELQSRRQNLLENIREYAHESSTNPEHHLVVIPSAAKQYMSDKIPYFFRQNTDFLYLTGCQEPDSCLVLTVNAQNEAFSTLFLREKDDHSELWDGPRTGPANAVELFGVDQSIAIGELENFLSSFSKSKRNASLWYDFTNPSLNSVHKVMCAFMSHNSKKLWESPRSLIHRQRLIKSEAEIALMQESCDVASNAIAKTIQTSHPGINESQIFAQVDYECRMNGAEYLAYPPVVAGGNRANIIHYINNNQIVKDGEMVLMDAGCELHGYSSDITRTWPINGKFTREQRELYEVVLNAQKELIKSCENQVTLDKLFDIMCESLGKGLQEIGLVQKTLSSNELKQAAYGFCPHHVSHYLGMDVHDTPSIGRNIPIQSGMIITIEPGIYVGKKYKKYLPESYQGLGIRIEDDVLITDNGPVVLSRQCPKEVEEIEALASANNSC